MREKCLISFLCKLKQSCASVLLILFLCCLPGSCDKVGSGPSDFRDMYTGKYQVHETIYSYGFPVCGEPYFSERDTIISVSYGYTDSTLLVLGRDIYVDSTGRGYDYHYGLRFRNDSIFSYFMNGGLGCGQYENHEGIRISMKP